METGVKTGRGFLEKRKQYRCEESGESKIACKRTYVKRYGERWSVDWQKVMVDEARGVGEEWKIFRGVLACARDVCSMRKVGRLEMVVNGETKLLAKEKKEGFRWYLQ